LMNQTIAPILQLLHDAISMSSRCEEGVPVLRSEEECASGRR
jgi:hypothetical protein